MYRLVEWNEKLNLEKFYNEASLRGFENNSSRQTLVDSFQNEKQKNVWILYYNKIPVGSTGCHSLDIFENKSFRICARTCVFSDLLPMTHLRSLGKTIKHHQNVTAQFFIPKCIEWAPDDADLYISTNESLIGSQSKVHRTYCPALASTGVLTKICDKNYRGHLKTFWKLNKQVFLDQLNSYPRWESNV